LKSPAQIATKAFRAWQARKFGNADPRPHRIDRRRIYILPTGFGLILATLDVAMLIAALNYNSNLALAFAFLMASLALVAMHHCHRNLLDLCIDCVPETDGFAGAPLEFRFLLRNPSRLARREIEVRCAQFGAAVTSIGAGETVALAVPIAAAPRGVLRLTQFEVRTLYPFRWFFAWTYVQAPLTAYLAPRPAGAARPRGTAGSSGASHETQGDEEFAGLRPYAPGTPLKHMAWKVLARGGEPAVRNYTGLAAEPEWLDWSALRGQDAESRLEQLCRWVLDASDARQSYGLKLPGVELVPAQGPAHRLACLRALAGFAAPSAVR
jgi:uncharacterized protein (DUF58 family)